MYCAHMLNHAQHKHKASKKHGGVKVNKRFRVEAYLETSDEVQLIDDARKILHQSRSVFVGRAAVEKADAVIGGAK